MAATTADRALANCSEQRAAWAGGSMYSGAVGEIKAAMAQQRYPDEKKKEKATAPQILCCRKLPERAQKPHRDAPSAELAAI